MCKHDLGFSRSGANFAIPNAMAGTRSGLPPACRCWARSTRHFETLSLRQGKTLPMVDRSGSGEPLPERRTPK